MEDLLYEFAEENGIHYSKVDEFLRKKKNITTIEELEVMPHELLNHYPYISSCPRLIRDFIDEHWYTERYKTYTLDYVLESVYDSMEYDENGEPLSIEVSTKNKELQEVIDCMIENKFGSVEYDW